MSAFANHRDQAADPGLLRRLRRNDRGTALIEYAITMALFLLLFFGLLDFGRAFYNWVTAEKATQMAARIATVRPAVCAGVPQSNARGSTVAATRFGDACNSGSNVCAGESLGTAGEPPGTFACTLPNTITCPATAAAGTGAEIWCTVRDLLPPNATPANLRFSYSFDPDMNFLGGPYVPVVTTEVRGLTFQFVSPIFGLGRLAGGTITGPNTPNNIPFPSMSVSLPGEDLALGNSG